MFCKPREGITEEDYYLGAPPSLPQVTARECFDAGGVLSAFHDALCLALTTWA